MDIVELSWSKPNGYMKFVAPLLGEGFSAKKQLFTASTEKQTEVVNSLIKEHLGSGPKVRITKVDLETWTIHFTTEPLVEPEVVELDFKAAAEEIANGFVEFLRKAAAGEQVAEEQTKRNLPPQEPGSDDYLAALLRYNIDLIHPLQLAVLMGGEHDPDDLASYNAIGLRTRSVNCSCGVADVVFAEIQERHSDNPYLEIHIDAGASVPIYMDDDLDRFGQTVSQFLEHLHQKNC